MAVDRWLSIRGLFPIQACVDNLFMATVQKTGSQWFRAVLSDPRITHLTGLKPYPQRRYEYTEFKRKFPRGVFVPGLYMSYDLYEEIKKPSSYRTFYVKRDPRDIIVSWYWSMKETHGLMGKVGKFRANLQPLEFDAGLHYCIDAFSMKLACMRSWALNSDDENIIFIEFDDIKNRPDSVIGDILDFAGAEYSNEALSSIVADYSKERMRERDLSTRLHGSESHYRSKASHHKEVFNDSHYDHFYAVSGDLVSLLGYPE